MYRQSHMIMGVIKSMTDEYFGETKRDEERLVLTPRVREDIVIEDKHDILTNDQNELLQNGASLDFCLGDYASLANMLNALGVKVRICMISMNLIILMSLSYIGDGNSENSPPNWNQY